MFVANGEQRDKWGDENIKVGLEWSTVYISREEVLKGNEPQG